MRPPLSKDTRLCISLAARPSNIGTRFHNHLYDVLGARLRLQGIHQVEWRAEVGSSTAPPS